MPDFGIYAGDTSKTIYVRLRDSTTGLSKTGLAFGDANATASYVLPLAVDQPITLATLASPSASWATGGFVEVDAVTAKGLYRLDLPNAAIASGDFTIINIEFDNVIEESLEIPLHTRKVNAIEVGGTTQTAGDVPAALALIPQSGGTTTWNATALAAIQTEADASLTSYAGPTKAEMDTAHGLLATEAKQDIIDTNVDDIETAIALVPQSGGTTTWNATALAAIQTEADASLTSYAGPTKAEMDTAHGLLATEAKQDIIDTNVDDIETAIALVPQSGGTTTWNATALAAIQTASNDAMVVLQLDHLLHIADTGSTTVASIIGKIVADDGDFGTFTPSTDSLNILSQTLAGVPQSTGTTSWNATALAAIQTEADASLTSYAGPTKAEMDTAHGLLATEAKQDIIDTNVDDIETAIALVPQSGGTTTWNATALAAIQTEADASLTSYAGPTKAEMDTAHGLLATPAQVNTQVLDVFTVDTFAEPTKGLPPATTTLANKIGFNYKAWRNRSTSTSSVYSLYNDDATTVDHDAAVSDDTTTAERSEMTDGP